MKASACGSRGAAALARMRSNRSASIWRSSGLIGVSLRAIGPAPRDMGSQRGRSKTGHQEYSHRIDVFTPTRLSRIHLRNEPRTSALGAGFGVLFDVAGGGSAMANVVVVGAQWGDEGKGKIVDWLSVSADVIVRFQGGHNAGHTLVIDGKVFKLALLPSGIVRPGKLSVIGNGVVLDPYHLVEEIEKLRGQGVEVTPANLKIAENVPLILSLHRELDAHRESGNVRGTKIGTTKRGIGPAYEDKVARRAIRLMDLADPDALDDKIARLLSHHVPLCRGLGLPPPTAAAVREEVLTVAPKVLPFMAPTFEILDAERRAGKRILFEGAQGAMLDVDHGTYPYVTSSNTVAANAATGSGLGPRAIGYVLGIAKAYTTRVGGGPFPTELDDEVGRLIGERGREFGTNTG